MCRFKVNGRYCVNKNNYENYQSSVKAEPKRYRRECCYPNEKLCPYLNYPLPQKSQEEEKEDQQS
jgi:hypothetical protein